MPLITRRSSARSTPRTSVGRLFGLGYKRKHGLLAILLVIFSSFIEIAQLFVPGRHARLSDFIIDAVAV
jgi:VanZ family protein